MSAPRPWTAVVTAWPRQPRSSCRSSVLRWPLNPAAEPPPGPAGDSAAAAARTAPHGDALEEAVGRPTSDVLDLGEASREAVLKRVVPVAAGLVALLLILWRRRR